MAFASFNGVNHKVIDIGFGGLRVDEYDGGSTQGEEFIIDGLGITEENLIAVHLECTVAHRLGDQLGIAFVKLDTQVYDVLDAIMMRRKKYFNK